jgi:hypothetical protein
MTTAQDKGFKKTLRRMLSTPAKPHESKKLSSEPKKRIPRKAAKTQLKNNTAGCSDGGMQ